jgi:trimethylamine:corrinoid methyltransferase-like protein
LRTLNPSASRSPRCDRLTPAECTRVHTMRRCRERWYPALIDRLGHATWAARGSLTLGERAAARVDALLASHEPPPLPEPASRAIAEILARAAGARRTVPDS